MSEAYFASLQALNQAAYAAYAAYKADTSQTNYDDKITLIRIMTSSDVLVDSAAPVVTL